MNRRRWPVSLIGSTIVFLAISAALGQNTPEVRRALPANEPPTARAVPFETPTPAPSPRPRRAPAVAPAEDASVPPEESTAPTEATPTETEAPDRRQLEYANALFGRKLYDLAIPEYEKFLGQFPGAPGRASAYFFLGESYRALNRSAAARDEFSERARRIRRKRICRAGGVRRRGNSLYAERLCWVVAVVPSRSGENEATRPGALSAVFRSSLFGKSRSKRRSS